jgi:predicted RNA-binding protein YlqC (UPF0109 family)
MPARDYENDPADLSAEAHEDLELEEWDDDDEDDDLVDEEGAPAVAAGPGNGRSAAVDDLATFIEFMVANLVDDPATIQVRPEQFGTNVHIKVIVPEEDMGRVIGRQGRIARSMRTLLTIAASRKGLRASLDIDS